MIRRPQGRAGRLRLIVIGAVVLFLLSISTIARVYTDLLWYKEISLSSVFWTVLGSKAALAAIFGFLFFLFLVINLFIAARSIPDVTVATVNDPLEKYRAQIRPYLRKIILGGSAFLAFLFALSVTPLWEEFQLALNASDFGTADPVFGKDIGFYVFQLPVYQSVYAWVFSALIVVALIVAGGYYLTGGINPQSVAQRVGPHVKAHLSVLLALIAALRAWGYRLDQFELLYSDRGTVTGASYTDIHAQLPALKLLVIISVIVAILFVVNFRFRGWVLPLAGLGLWLLTFVLAAVAYPSAIQRFQVLPSELQRERQFIERNIESTRASYGLQDIEVKEFAAKAALDSAEVQANTATTENIRLWDPETLKTAYKQLQEIRLYYQFGDVDVDRYTLDGKLQQVMLSVRELDLPNLGEKSWQNEHLIFTHGQGVVMSTTNGADDEGQPDFLIKELPPETTTPELEIKEGGIYFGEALGRDVYSVVNTDQEELDFPLASGVQRTKYAGKAGVELSGPIRRIAFGWRFRDVNIVISGLINSDSRILFYRQIRERLEKSAPFLRFDGDPYAVVVDGRVVWMIDGYTVSDRYPYSERIDFSSRTVLRGPQGRSPAGALSGDNNYIRNSVKVTVDSYDGTMKFYVWDPTDPIIRSWQKVFPELFSDAGDMPDSVRAHVRYPEDLFRIQTSLYLRYHMLDTTDFYSQEDLWVIPPDPSDLSSSDAELQPYYVLMRLPGEDKEQYILILPTNPKTRPNMVSILAAKSDPEEYGDLLDLRFPRGIQRDGVSQVSARIQQNPIISEIETLLGQGGSRVIFGNLLVIPIGESILYAQPMFIQAQDNPIPELKRVILATSDRVVMRDNLDDALKALLEGGPPAIPTDGEDLKTVTQLLDQALRHFTAADAALKAGDLATYANEIAAAREAVRKAVEE